MACNEYIERVVGNSLGKMEEVDLKNGEVKWGEYMRIRVNIDITKLLLRCNKLHMGLIDAVWLKFSYKRLTIAES